MAADLNGGALVDRLGRERATIDRHANGDLGAPGWHMRGRDRARHAVALGWCWKRDHRATVEQPRALQRDQLGIARADTDAVRSAAHGLVADHWVTGMAARQAVRSPIGAAWLTAIRVSAPP